MNILSFIDDFLSTYTMYRVVLYGLRGIVFFTILFGFLGILPYSGLSLIASLLVIIVSCYVVNLGLSFIFHAPTNSESWTISALILYLIMIPVTDMKSVVILILAGTISMASKYIVAINKKHIFNPAAFGAFALSIFHHGAVWWIGSAVMTPIVVVIGLLIVRKVRKFHLFFSFLFVSLVTIFIMSLINNSDGIAVLRQAITSWPLLFLGTIMLTEPFTFPPTQNLQMLYGSFVGFIMASQVHFGSYSVSAETALIIGNIYSYIVNSKTKLFLHLKNKIQVASDIIQFSFIKPQSVTFIPGQYMEWTLPHSHSDTRGNRRYFTIASSPTENTIMIGVRITPEASSYKRKLSELQPNETVVASQIAGDFILPDDPTKKLVFFAGGIGVTPFRSMMKYLLDTNQKRDIVIIYSAKSADEFAYKQLFDEAVNKLGITIIYTITIKENLPLNWNGAVGRIDADLIQNEIKDYRDRIFYLSGPNAMVSSYNQLLKSISVPQAHIKTDFFPGFA